MSVLSEMSDNGRLREIVENVVDYLEVQCECIVASFNIVLETESGHCVVSLAKERK